MSNPAKINKEKLFINNKFLKTKKPVSQIFLTIYETDFSNYYFNLNIFYIHLLIPVSFVVLN